LRGFSICDIIDSTMPRWIYNRPPDKYQSMEIRFAQNLNDLLPDNWIVRRAHSVHGTLFLVQVGFRVRLFGTSSLPA